MFAQLCLGKHCLEDEKEQLLVSMAQQRELYFLQNQFGANKTKGIVKKNNNKQ